MMDQTLAKLLRPDVLIFLIPIIAISGVAARKMLSRYYEHKERMARIEAGLDPDMGDDLEEE